MLCNVILSLASKRSEKHGLYHKYKLLFKADVVYDV